MDLKSLINEFNKDFVYSEEVAKVLYLGYTAGENVVLYGKGGHNKSGYAEYFFMHMKKTPFVKVLGKGTLIEDLFGGLDIKKFQDEGKLEYFVENSFMAHEYVVFEEAFDAPLPVLEQLKDILTSKKFRNGSQVYEIKTKFIVICTNRSKQEIADDDSIKALMERFPLELKVEWKEYFANNYNEMFKKVLKKDLSELAMIIEKVNAYNFISPRTAIKAAKIYIKDGHNIDNLKFIAGFSAGVLDSIKENIRVIREEANLANKFNLVNSKIIETIASDSKYLTSTNVIKCLQLAKMWQEVKAQLENFRVNDKLYNSHKNLMVAITKHILDLNNNAYASIKTDTTTDTVVHKGIIESIKT